MTLSEVLLWNEPTPEPSREGNFKNVFLIILLFIFSCTSYASEYIYSVPPEPWPEEMGNHRAVVYIDKPAEAVRIKFDWRRHDRDPDKRRFIVVNSETGVEVKNIQRVSVTNEICDIVIGPVRKEGIYYFYYLPYEVQDGWGFYSKDYLKRETGPDVRWVNKNSPGSKDILNQLPVAEVKEIQSRTQFDSFWPMEIIPLKEEKEKFLLRNNLPYLLFPENRRFPIRMKDEIPHRWVKSGTADSFSDTVFINEYYAFQIGVYAVSQRLDDVRVSFSDFTGPGGAIIDRTKLTCFNTGGIDPFGNSFIKKVDVELGKVQPLWIGTDIGVKVKPGRYSGIVTIEPQNAAPQEINVAIIIKNEILKDRGDGETWRHSRLRWLNSKAGLDNKPVAPYYNISRIDKDTYKILGRKIILGDDGMPEQIVSWGDSILSRPVSFIIETKKEEGEPEITQVGGILEEGLLSEEYKIKSENYSVKISNTLEFDGYMNYKVRINATNDIKIEDARLEIPFKPVIAKYMKLMGLPGEEVGMKTTAKWHGPFDSFWIGNADGGIWCELRGSTYHGPLLNLYKPPYPESWHNDGKGSVSVEKKYGETLASVNSGNRTLKKGESITFEFALLVTPVKKVNYKSQFTDRYYHHGGKPEPTQEDFDAGVKIVNVHHANELNPYINYPFIAVNEMKSFVDELHAKDKKVKIYYTVRELTNNVTEIWALRSLGDEVLRGGKGGGYPWLREHLIDDYYPQWYQHYENKPVDASILTSTGESRWYNYYIEGLSWLVENIGIDGLYLDDVAYDRRILKRMRKVMEAHKPGCLIDLHSNTGFSKGPVTQYADFFPYIDKLWFGESFRYDSMSSANWFTEVSGIPFGLMGDMLHAGGNRWLGMVFGMTVRYPWLTEGVKCDPVPVWKLWDEFRIHESKMIGFWDKNPVVKTGNDDVKSTAYVKDDEVLIAIGNFSDRKQTLSLRIDWKSINMSKDKVKFEFPYIKDFQEAGTYVYGDELSLLPARGVILRLRRTD